MGAAKIGLYIAEILYRIGGTESYTVKLAQALQTIFPEAGIFFVTELFDKNKKPSNLDFVNRLNETYGCKLDSRRVFLKPVKCSKSNFILRRIMYKKIQDASNEFDLFFYCSVGNLVFKAKVNIAVIHFPAKKIVEQKRDKRKFDIPLYTSRKDKQYISAYSYFLPNSKFTETWLKNYWQEIPNEKIKMIYHPVIPIKNLNMQKEKIIIACGRIEKSKCLEILIDAFKKSDTVKKEYKFFVVGAVGKDEEQYLSALKERSIGCNIEFVCNAPHQTLTELYNKAAIFWHAKGVNEENPYKMEHFGMTTVEAMSVGCVPVVINKAGQMEIVNDTCGFKWNTIDELVKMTETLINDWELIKRLSKNAVERSKLFSEERFVSEMRGMLDSVAKKDIGGGVSKYVVFACRIQEGVANAA